MLMLLRVRGWCLIVRRRGFSLLEIVLVVAIVAVFAAMAVPRVSRGTKGASETALAADLRNLRDAVERFASDHHGQYPTRRDIVGQLTQYTGSEGEFQANRDAQHSYGPYLRAVPSLPVGLSKGCVGIDKKSQENDPEIGWIYDDETGAIRANCKSDEVDSRGTAYAAY